MSGQTDTHILAVRVEAVTDNPDLLHELFRSIIAEGLAQYSEWGELTAFSRLTVHITTPRGETYKLVEYRERESNDPSEQLAMPGL